MTAQKLKIPFRVVSVFVAICLVFSCFSVLSVPADATAAVAGGLVIIGGVVGVGIILQAMGVRPTNGSSSMVWQDLCANGYAYLQTIGLATIKGIPLATREGRAYVMRDVISALQDWLYASKTIQRPIYEFGENGSISLSCPSNGVTYNYIGCTAPVRCITFYVTRGMFDDGTPKCWSAHYHYSAGTFSLNGSSAFQNVNYQLIESWYMREGYGMYMGESDLYADQYFKQYILPHAATPIEDILADGFYFDVIRPDFGTEIETTYETWGNTARVVEFPDPDSTDPEDPDDDPPKVPKPGWPIWFPKLGGIEFPDDKPQREIQDPDPDPDLDDDKDSEREPDPGPDPDPPPDPDPEPDPTSPTVKPDNHDPTEPTRPPTPPPSGKDPIPPFIDLREYFPFCIPFDLYKMFSCLVADPVTPSFTIGIPSPKGIVTYTISLSRWNGIAAMLRSAEVAAFCLGLYSATRKYIKW